MTITITPKAIQISPEEGVTYVSRHLEVMDAGRQLSLTLAFQNQNGNLIWDFAHTSSVVEYIHDVESSLGGVHLHEFEGETLSVATLEEAGALCPAISTVDSLLSLSKAISQTFKEAHQILSVLGMIT